MIAVRHCRIRALVSHGLLETPRRRLPCLPKSAIGIVSPRPSPGSYLASDSPGKRGYTVPFLSGLQAINCLSNPPLTTHSSSASPCPPSQCTSPAQILLTLLPVSCPSSFNVAMIFPVFASIPRKAPSSPFTQTPDPSGRQQTCGVE